MTVADDVHWALRDGGVDFAVHVPDSVLEPVARRLDADPDVPTYVASREDEAVAMATGAYYASRVPVALMEGSGVGYCALILARAQLQRSPLLLMVGHSRALGEPMDYHGATRLAGQGVVDGLGIPSAVVQRREDAAEFVRRAAVTVVGQKSVVALFFPPYVFTGER
jgi:sulfopyruvate decarboxylase TPP-binding subunit